MDESNAIDTLKHFLFGSGFRPPLETMPEEWLYWLSDEIEGPLSEHLLSEACYRLGNEPLTDLPPSPYRLASEYRAVLAEFTEDERVTHAGLQRLLTAELEKAFGEDRTRVTREKRHGWLRDCLTERPPIPLPPLTRSMRRAILLMAWRERKYLLRIRSNDGKG